MTGMDKNARIYVAGHRGMVGSAITRKLIDDGYSDVVTRTHADLPLDDATSVEAFFASQRPEYVVLAAAKVGGIQANATRGAEFIRDNLAIQTNVIDAAYRHGARKLLFLGSAASIPSTLNSPSWRSRFSPGRSKKQTCHMRSPRSPGKPCATRTPNSTVSTRSP